MMELNKCPKCGLEPFEQFIPCHVRRFDFFGLRSKVWAVICKKCKEVVAWEDDKSASIEMKRQFGVTRKGM